MKASEARQKAYVINMQETSNQYQAIMREVEIAIQKGKTDCMYFDPIKDEVLTELAKDGYSVEYISDGRNTTNVKISWDDGCVKVVDMKEHILNGIDDMCSNFFYYDRKNDEELSSVDIQQAYDDDVIALDDMVCRFRNNCIDILNNRNDG